ncbi:MAG: MBL fold metallo-hydrolase [bacterium]
MQVIPHGGVGEIGGNCFAVESGRTRVLLDFGVSFKRYGQAFSEFLKPRKVNGIGDWLLSGVAPDIPGLYRQDYRGQNGLREEARGVDAVFVSHPHIDHLGLVPLVRPDIPIVSSPTAFAVARAIEDTGGSFDQSDFTRFRAQFRMRAKTSGDEGQLSRVKYSDAGERGETPMERPWHTAAKMELDGITAHLLPVDHSIHGARGILLEGDVQVAYSGDMRFHGRHKEWSERFVERCAGVDVLLVEGTNVANDKDKASARGPAHLEDFKALQQYNESGVESYIAEQLAGEHGYVFVAYPQRDLDRLETFVRVARKTGRRLALTPKQAYLLDMVHATASKALDAPVTSTDDADVCIYMPRKSWGLVEREDLWDTNRNLIEQDYQGWERPYLSHPKTVHRRDIQADPGKYLVFADIWNLTELHEFAAPTGGLNPPGGAYVNSKTEPFSEDMVQDRARLLWWLKRWGLREVGAHVSGHASAAELVKMAQDMGAKRIVPIHTEHADHYASLLGPRAVAPRLGAPVPL